MNTTKDLKKIILNGHKPGKTAEESPFSDLFLILTSAYSTII